EATTTAGKVDSTDLLVDFGTVKLLPGGKAFTLGDEENTVPVGKTWADLSPDTSDLQLPQKPQKFLVEMVDFLAIKPQLDKLTKQKHASLEKPRSSRDALLASSPSSRPRKATTSPLLVRGDGIPVRDGVVLDFALGTAIPLPSGAVAWWKAENNAN